ncbi:MAG: hypothetical protein H6721_00970 [Sandaracinus sp.]|nr:hypothetical protein [Sandaracinus sp.]MCB9630715.1 hypothetical protein [Sandaracinus sp.]
MPLTSRVRGLVLRIGLGLLVVVWSACGATPAESVPSRAPTPVSQSPNDAPIAVEAPLVDYRIRVVEASPDAVVDVRFTFDLAFVEPAPQAVILHFASLELEDGDSSATRFILPESPAVRDADTITWPVVDGRVTGGYRVTLAHHRHEPRRGVDNVPHPTAGGWTVPGTAFLPTLARLDDGRALDGDVAAAFELPDAWVHHHSAPDELSRAASQHAASPHARFEHFADLAHAVHTFGHYAVHAIRRGESEVRLVSADYDEATLEPLRRLVERTLDLGERWLGPLPRETRTIVVDRVGARYEGGLVGVRGIVLSGPDLGSLHAHEMPGLIVVHELAHLWARADVPWLNEGLARFLEIALGVALEGLPPEVAQAELDRRLARYYELAGDHRAIVADTQGAWPYEGGLVLLACAEAELRAAGDSLFALHRRLRERDGLPVRTEAFVEALDRAAPGAGQRLRERLHHAGPFPMAACFEGLGFDVSTREVAPPTARALVVDALRVTGIDGTRVVSVAPRSVLHVGDTITSVSTDTPHEVATLDAFRWVLRDPRLRRVTLQVLRDGRAVDVPLRLPRNMERVPREILELAPGQAGGRLIGE